MALSLNVPVSPSAFYNMSIENNSYKFSFRWQTRGKCWYFSMEDSKGNVISRNVKLTPNMSLMRQNLDKAPKGSLQIIKRTNDFKQIPGRSNVGPGKDFELMYYSVEEGG